MGDEPGDVLGRGFRRTWLASAVSNVGDGLRLAALPLLAASLTRDPILIASLTVTLRLPGLLFALPFGVVVDRVNRKRMLIRVTLARSGILAILAASVVLDIISMPFLLVVAFALGLGETLFDTGIQTWIPELVDGEHLEKANGRLQSTELVANEFAGPPIGSVLFTAAPALPFAFDAVSFVASAKILTTVQVRSTWVEPSDRKSAWVALKEGVKALAGHSVMRLTVAYSGVRNLLFGAVAGIFVLYALEVVDVGSVGFGLLLTAEAIGGFVGGVSAAKLTVRTGIGLLLVLSTVIHGTVVMGLALVPQPLVAGVLIAVAAAGTVASTVALVSLRQRLTPSALLGRVNSAARFVSVGALTLGSGLGGIVAETVDIRTAFLLAGVGLVLLGLIVAIPLSNERICAAPMLRVPDQRE